MPGENYTFTTHVDPGSPPQRGPPAQRVVEAPGTAPGSATIIPSSVYRHSRRSPADPANIGGRGAKWKRPIGRHERPSERSATADLAGRTAPPGITDTMPIDDHKRAEIEAQRATSQETRRVTVSAMEAILYERFDVLDHGFVRVIDYMGDDAAIVQAARVSYGAGTRKVREDRALIRYLLRHRHTTPFEMCELKLHIKAPIFVARQWLRHRTASVNEYSARYSRLDREFYVPDADHLQSIHEEQIGRQRASSSGMDDLFGSTEAAGERLALAAQSDSNMQGRDDVLTDEEARQALSRLDWISNPRLWRLQEPAQRGRQRGSKGPGSCRACPRARARGAAGQLLHPVLLEDRSAQPPALPLAPGRCPRPVRNPRLCRRDPRQDRHELGAGDL